MENGGNSENLEGEIILRHREPREKKFGETYLWRERRRTEHGEGEKIRRNNARKGIRRNRTRGKNSENTRNGIMRESDKWENERG